MRLLVGVGFRFEIATDKDFRPFLEVGKQASAVAIPKDGDPSGRLGSVALLVFCIIVASYAEGHVLLARKVFNLCICTNSANNLCF